MENSSDQEEIIEYLPSTSISEKNESLDNSMGSSWTLILDIPEDSASNAFEASMLRPGKAPAQISIEFDRGEILILEQDSILKNYSNRDKFCMVYSTNSQQILFNFFGSESLLLEFQGL